MNLFKTLNNLSVRSKIWIGFSLVLIIFVLQGIRSVDNLQTVSTSFDQMALEIQPAVLNAANLEARIEAVSSGLGLYLLTKDTSHKKAFAQNLEQLEQIIKLLNSSDTIIANEASNQLIIKIQNMVKKLPPYRDQLFQLTEDDDKNILAIGYANDNVNPLIRDMIQLTSEMLTSEAEEEFQLERLEILNTIHHLRYNLINLVTEMRLFLAFKTTTALANVELYRSVVDVSIIKLGKYGEDGLLTLEQEDAVEKFNGLESVFIKNFSHLVEIHGSDKWRQDAYLIKTEVGPLLAEIKELIRELVVQQNLITTSANDSIHVLVNAQSQQFYMIAAAVILLVIVIAWVLSRKITMPLKYSVEIANSIANGFLQNKIKVNSTDETGQLLDALDEMQTKLHENIVQERKVSNENARVKEALDNVSAKVMVADQNNDIIYLNNAALTLFTHIEADIAQAIPGFKAGEILGSNMDKFHKDPRHQQTLVKTLTTRHEASFMTGSRSMSFIANPVISANNDRLGTVVEWQDKTEEIKIEQEIQSIVDSVKQGDLNQRIQTIGKTGFVLGLSEGINEMVEELSDTLHDIDTSMSALSQGDLTRTIDREYIGTFGSVASNVNQTINRLGQIVGAINEASVEVSSTANEIKDGNNSLSSRTEHQASALEQTASSMEQITSTVKQNSDSAQLGNQLSTEAREMANKGGQVVSDAVIAMQEINNSSKKIAEIISVIDEIAFQTNLLALNASVEAARAGEQGRGFAVVATEVRNLAGRSATAAKEIKDLIHDSVQKVNAGSELVNKSGETLKEIVQSVQKVVDVVGEIALASHEQSTGIEQVNAAVTSMDETTQQNAALAEQTSAASVHLTKRTHDMALHLQFFTRGSSMESQPESVESHYAPTKPDFSASSGLNLSENKTIIPKKSSTSSIQTKVVENEFADEWEEF